MSEPAIKYWRILVLSFHHKGELTLLAVLRIPGGLVV